jgi:hypothetical protein
MARGGEIKAKRERERRKDAPFHCHPVGLADLLLRTLCNQRMAVKRREPLEAP